MELTFETRTVDGIYQTVPENETIFAVENTNVFNSCSANTDWAMCIWYYKGDSDRYCLYLKNTNTYEPKDCANYMSVENSRCVMDGGNISPGANMVWQCDLNTLTAPPFSEEFEERESSALSRTVRALQAPSLSSTVVDLALDVGESVVLKCLASRAVPAVTLLWTLNGNTVGKLPPENATCQGSECSSSLEYVYVAKEEDHQKSLTCSFQQTDTFGQSPICQDGNETCQRTYFITINGVSGGAGGGNGGDLKTGEIVGIAIGVLLLILLIILLILAICLGWCCFAKKETKSEAREMAPPPTALQQAQSMASPMPRHSSVSTPEYQPELPVSKPTTLSSRSSLSSIDLAPLPVQVHRAPPPVHRRPPPRPPKSSSVVAKSTLSASNPSNQLNPNLFPKPKPIRNNPVEVKSRYDQTKGREALQAKDEYLSYQWEGFGRAHGSEVGTLSSIAGSSNADNIDYQLHFQSMGQPFHNLAELYAVKEDGTGSETTSTSSSSSSTIREEETLRIGPKEISNPPYESWI